MSAGGLCLAMCDCRQNSVWDLPQGARVCTRTSVVMCITELREVTVEVVALSLGDMASWCDPVLRRL